MTFINADVDEKYPYVSVAFEDEESQPGGTKFYPVLELTAEEAADLREVRDRWNAWQSRLSDMHDERYRT